MKWLAHKLLGLRGWRFEGIVPSIPKMIVIGAPHTTNWDFVVFLAALHHFQLKVRYLGKHTLFRWPFGYFFTATGGIPVDRTQTAGIVHQVASAFDATDRMVLVLAPEGTRKPARCWKSGFLSIAAKVNVPIVLAGIDYSTKTVTLGEAQEFDGNVSGFMDIAREFYSDKRGLHPENETPVALRQEPDLS